ncbi:MAG: hypothetical protein RXQ62_05455, partial [Nitrososphaeria archaeon]
MDERNHRLVLRDFNLEIDFAGGLRWHGKQGRLEIRHDGARGAWYAFIPVEVGVETTRNGNESKHIVRGERRSIRMVESRGDGAAACAPMPSVGLERHLDRSGNGHPAYLRVAPAGRPRIYQGDARAERGLHGG